MDLMIKKFEAGLVDYINSAQLPLELKRLVMAEVMVKVEQAVNVAVLEQQKAEEKGAEQDAEKES